MEPIAMDVPVVFGDLLFRIVRYWDPIKGEYRNKMGRVCECGQMIPYFVQITPLGTDWDNDAD